MTLPDDTQPKSPFREQQNYSNLIPPEPEPTGAGCGVWAVIWGMIILLALAIVGLAGAAGWTSGVRIAQVNATATYQADIDIQIRQISTDVAGGNLAIADIRIKYLATQTPGIPQVPGLQQTGTAVFLTNQPSPTPTPTETLTPTEPAAATSAPTTAVEITAAPDGSLDLPDLLDDARAAVNEARWTDAIELLDIIISADPQFETSTVNSLMSNALNKESLKLFRSGNGDTLAEAINLANRAELFGPLQEGVAVEREVATLYLNAKARINTNDYAGSIRYLLDALALSPNYLDAGTLLVRQYIAYGDALNAGGQPCQAVDQYTNAINRNGSPDATAKRTAAQFTCDNGTPTPPGFVATTDPNVTPIGQP